MFRGTRCTGIPNGVGWGWVQTVQESCPFRLVTGSDERPGQSLQRRKVLVFMSDFRRNPGGGTLRCLRSLPRDLSFGLHSELKLNGDQVEGWFRPQSKPRRSLVLRRSMGHLGGDEDFSTVDTNHPTVHQSLTGTPVATPCPSDVALVLPLPRRTGYRDVDTPSKGSHPEDRRRFWSVVLSRYCPEEDEVPREWTNCRFFFYVKDDRSRYLSSTSSVRTSMERTCPRPVLLNLGTYAVRVSVCRTPVREGAPFPNHFFPKGTSCFFRVLVTL